MRADHRSDLIQISGLLLCGNHTGRTREGDGNGTGTGPAGAGTSLWFSLEASVLRNSHSHLTPIPNVSLELGNSGRSRPPPDPRAHRHTCNFSITFFWGGGSFCVSLSVCLPSSLRTVPVQVRLQEPSAAADCAPRSARVSVFAPLQPLHGPEQVSHGARLTSSRPDGSAVARDWVKALQSHFWYCYQCL